MEMIKRFFCFIKWHSFLVGYDHNPIEGNYKCKWCSFRGEMSHCHHPTCEENQKVISKAEGK